jgi:hypothetical protein
MIGIVLGADKLLFVALETADHLASLHALLSAEPVARAGLKFNSPGSERFFRRNMDPFIDPVPLECLSSRAGPDSGSSESRTWDTVTRLGSLSEACISRLMPALVEQSCETSSSSGVPERGRVLAVCHAVTAAAGRLATKVLQSVPGGKRAAAEIGMAALSIGVLVLMENRLRQQRIAKHSKTWKVRDTSSSHRKSEPHPPFNCA